ncbi:MAG: SH3 domain-containing protein [Campylobacterales bacterium]|nr:SH3 domain-containing protein [Campylobacterales bacterium]
MITKVLSIGLIIILGGCSTAPLPTLHAPVCTDKNGSLVSDEPIVVHESESDLPSTIEKMNDLLRFPQDISPYVERNGVDHDTLYETQQHFNERYYRPWSYTVAPICAKEAAWAISAFRRGYGSNLKLYDSSWFTQMEEESNFQAFSTLNQRAITTRWMSLRVFPTSKPLYKNPARAGDGYPFDLLQNSSVAFNEPIFISHTSKDGAWSYIFTNNASGWVESNAVATLSSNQIETLQSKEQLFITEDRTPLYDEKNRFVTYSRIGMVLPYVSENDESYKTLWVNTDGKTSELLIPKSSAHVGISVINKGDLTKIGANLLRNTYGWGGMFEERDCSSMIRDYLTPFGIWLPRNSAQQAKKGEVISFKDLNNTQKIELIKEKGVPFETILYKKGHVLLYVGTFEDTVMAMHNIWGVRTKNKDGTLGRAIIGHAVISTLELGSDVKNFDPNGMLLSTLTSMNIFTKEPIPLAQKKEKRKLSSL